MPATCIKATVCTGPVNQTTTTTLTTCLGAVGERQG